MTAVRVRLLAIIAVLLSAPAWSGMQIEIADPLYFERSHEVIFPWADAKLVSFEFESVAGIEGGKKRAKELHDLFLGKIQGLPGGAVLTFLTPEGQRIENYRITAREAAKQQQAQMSVWGRMFPDASGISLINVRLELVEPPNGTQVPFEGRVGLSHGKEQPIRGNIKDEVTQTRIDFLTVEETNVGALAEFLSGLAFYYKGAKDDNARSKRLLQTSIDHLLKYIEQTRDRVDYSAASAANLYIARAYYHLSRQDSAGRNSYLAKAEQYATDAVELNPYEADPYTALAVIQSARGRSAEQIEGLLAKAVSHAPGSATASYNLALVKSGAGHLKDAIQRLEQVEYLQTQDKLYIYKDVGKLQDTLRTIREEP
jgi:tetratricopeptide (TPR) repeat protein